MQKFYRGPVREENGIPIIAADSTTFNEVDPVYINSNGFLTTVIAGSKILGFCREYKVTTSDNTTVAKYKPQFAPAAGQHVIFGSDSDCTQAKLHNYKNFGTVTSGAFEVALANITGGQLKIVEFDPFDESDDDAIVVVVAEPQLSGFVQA